MKKIKEVIVVEGKDDTKRINMAVDADTIETRGSAVPEETLDLIERIAEKRGIIIFTDPDFSGEKIRKTVAEVVPNAKHAFIKKSQGVPSKSDGSLGVEHASVESIQEALKHVYTEDDQADELISQEDLINAHLIGTTDAKERRKQIGEILNIGYVNGKQLQKRLRMFGISQAMFNQAIQKINQEDQ